MQKIKYDKVRQLDKIVFLALSALLTSSLHVWLGVSDNVIKIPVDIVLFFLSYTLQRKWVFHPTR